MTMKLKGLGEWWCTPSDHYYIFVIYNRHHCHYFICL